MSLELAAVGAIVGGSGGAAAAYSEYRAGRIGPKRAAARIASEAAGLGLSAVVGVTAAGAFAAGGLPWFAALFTTTAATKYVWDRGADRARNALYVFAVRVAFERAARRARQSASSE